MAGHLLNDVVVIGSGPAGCSAAITCYHAGLKVLMVTEEDKPENVSSSAIAPLESIHPGVSSLLAKIGAEDSSQLASRAYYAAISVNGMIASLGGDSHGIWQGNHINRDVFDAHLFYHVQDLGVEIKYKSRVENILLENKNVIGIKAGSDHYYAKYIIDASGKNAITGKKLSFKRKFYSPPLVCWTGVSEISGPLTVDNQVAHFIPVRNGWTWLAPQPPDYCSWTRLSVKGEKSMVPPDELKKYPVIGKIHMANMRWRLYRPLCQEGLVLCGDAAGILDPAAGQGIFNAIQSGIMASNTVTACIKEQDVAGFHLAYYDSWFMEQFEMKVNKLKSYYEEHGIDVTSKHVNSR